MKTKIPFTLLTAVWFGAHAFACTVETPADDIAADDASTEKKCGMNGNTVYALDCQTLKAQCDGAFTCADPVPSNDGSCSTWGECTEGQSLEEPDEPLDKKAPDADEEKKCGMNGNTVYALDCQTLKAQCNGEFTCADPVPSSDGSCSTWGECTEGSSSQEEPTLADLVAPDEDEDDEDVDPDDDVDPDEPKRAIFCGYDSETETDYGADCALVKRECSVAGGVFLCDDLRKSDECRTWGACHFLTLVAVSVDQEPEPLPPKLDVQSTEGGPQADISTFGCGEDEFCCLFVPGAGDGSTDCGGWLAECELIGCTPSGGNHVGKCSC